MSRGVCSVVRLGRVDYEAAWRLQRELAEARASERTADVLLLLEHPPTYTIGRRGDEAHLLVRRDDLRAEGIDLIQVDRGGDITFHGPGQLVGYPVISLAGRPGGPGKYLRDIEETIMLGLSGVGVSAGRSPGLTGVWVGDEKIAAIGVKINAKRVTGHGFALNVTTDLGYFEKIVPCGIRGKGVTSLERVLRRRPSMEEVADEIVRAFGRVFDLTMTEGALPRLEPICIDEVSLVKGAL